MTKPQIFKPLNSFFDRIYVLTLTRAKQRQHYIEEKLGGLDFHFFWGIDGRDLSLEDLIRSGQYDRDTFLKTKRGQRDMSLGEVACALSHRAIYEDTVSMGYNRVLILEDDVHPIPAQLMNFEQLIHELPLDWELFMLGYTAEKKPSLYHAIQKRVYLLYHHLKWFNWHKISKAWIKQMCMKPCNDSIWELGKVGGGHAYALTLETAKRFVDYQTPIQLQADRVFYYFKVEKGLNAYLPQQRLFDLSALSQHSFIGYDSVRGLDGLAKKYMGANRISQKHFLPTFLTDVRNEGPKMAASARLATEGACRRTAQ